MANTALLSASILLLAFLLQSQIQAFKVVSFKSTTHGEITRAAILQTTAEVCRSQAIQQGRHFELPNPLTEQSLAAACSSPDSTRGFITSIVKIILRNAWVDLRHVLNAIYHFDDESFLLGRELITQGMNNVKASVKQQNYEGAREQLGEILHTLQDFYSHSNWIELANNGSYTNLIKANTKIDNIADSATCSSCNEDVCKGNILPKVITDKKLTSGYFSLYSTSKPAGKCSHGGLVDLTSYTEPKGGINKDDVDSSHGYLHRNASEVAIAASRELLEDIRAAVGDPEFLRLMGFSQTSVLCFVIDTTGSMSDDIAEVRRVTSLIIDKKKGTTNQPSEYILVPFNDPTYGPLTRTTDPEVFKNQINALSATGGGDEPEMCLSGLEVALTGSPPQTEVFVFTDASAKDIALKSTVMALIERTKSVVNFLLTNALTARRRRSSNETLDDQQRFSSRISNLLNQDYLDLAQASGGQAIEVTKSTIPEATSIIVDTSSSSLVTVLQVVRNPAVPENFTFFVDTSLQNLTIYLTCTSPYYKIISPLGVSQTSNEQSGILGVIQTIGNFHTIYLNNSHEVGLWHFYMSSTVSYSIKVVGQSEINFLFDFIEVSQWPHLSYAVLNSRPSAENNLTLLLTMIGGDSVKPTEVVLVESSSSNSFNGTLEEVANRQYFVTFNTIPTGEFKVCIFGEGNSKSSNDRFQRQSPTQFQASSVIITAQANGTLEPGITFTLPFTVATNGTGGRFSIKVRNDRNFKGSFPGSVTLTPGGSANSTITLHAPENTPSGTDVTVTIEVEAPGGDDSNYAVLRLAVVAPVSDIAGPVCEIVSINANCPGNCSLASWYLSANMTDGNGTGIQRVVARPGVGTLNISTMYVDGGQNVTLVFYKASCCFPDVELVAVDAVGNVGSCFRSVAKATVHNSAQSCLFPSVFIWLNFAAIILFQVMHLI